MIFDIYILSRSLILSGTDREGTEDSCYGTQNEQENTHDNVIERYIRRDMAVYIDHKYQEKVKSADNMFCKMKQRYNFNKVYEDIDIPDVE